MNFEKFIQATKDYLSDHLGTYSRGDLHIMPQIGREDLLNYIRNTYYTHFPRARFSRFIQKLRDRRMILDSDEKTLTFDPVFPYSY